MKVAVAGLPPRHKTDEIRTKVKDYNEAMSKWCDTNTVDFINNEDLFEFRSGEVDKGSYIMTGATPAVHLTRQASLRMLDNIRKEVPTMILSESRYQMKPSYAQVLVEGKSKTNHPISPKSQHKPGTRQVVCWHCGIQGHTKYVCKYDRPLQCHSCREFGHKKKYCDRLQ